MLLLACCHIYCCSPRAHSDLKPQTHVLLFPLLSTLGLVMLLKDFTQLIHQLDRHIGDSITIEEVMLFGTIASDLVFRAGEALHLDYDRRPLAYLAKSLPTVSHDTIDVLWKVSFGFLHECYVDSRKASVENGVLPEMPDGSTPIRVPQYLLLPPITRNCPQCDTGKSLMCKDLFGYLYDLDGCHTVQHFSYYCQGESHKF